MAQRRPYQQQRRKSAPRSSAPPAAPVIPAYLIKTPPKVYGKPFVLLEDEQKNTFEYQGGTWVAYARTIAECRVDCDVKQLSQKVNKMTRYEVRLQIASND